MTLTIEQSISEASNTNKEYHELLNNLYKQVIKDFDIDFNFNPNYLAHIPAKGSFIVISNHPLKGIDNVLLLHALAQKRPDIKLLNAFSLPKYKDVRRFFIKHNSKQFFKLFNSGVRLKTIDYLNRGVPIGIFPAGDFEPQAFFSEQNDNFWNSETIRFIKEAQVPVIPVGFSINSNFSLFPKHHQLIIPEKRKLDNDKKKFKVQLRIGSPISISEQSEFTNIDKFGKYLRARVYSLQSGISVKKYFTQNIKPEPKPQAIQAANDVEIIKSEIASIKNKLLFTSGYYQVYCVASKFIPVTMNEIGRLREITFREVGEGTNRSIDVDEYDLYYQQLIIWDSEKCKIVGGYRFGKGDEILKQYDIKGFYTQSLFRISPEAKELLSQSLELGRSFVVKEYQRKPLSLFLLWKGILYYLLKNNQYRYLIGPVSISNQYSTASKSLIIKFLKENYFHSELSQVFKPRNAFKPKVSAEMDVLLEPIKNNLNKMDGLIADIEIEGYKLPVLLKKYLKLNARIISFNIDPKFNNALDGLILLDLMDVPNNTIKTLSKEINDESILNRFINQNNC